MANTIFLDDDVVRIYAHGKPRKDANLLATLFWGDEVRVLAEEADGSKLVELTRYRWDVEQDRYVLETYEGTLPAKARVRDTPLLKVRFIDVGQGDGALIETPEGRRILVDGGEEEHLRRYLQVAFSHVIQRKPLHFDAIVVTHGDADHFAGLTRLARGIRPGGGPLISVDRVFHNGLVKRGSKNGQGRARPDKELFGRTVERNGHTYVVDLVDDLLAVPEAEMNTPFRDWTRALRMLQEGHPELATARLEFGADDAFGFLADEGVHVSVLGPVVEPVGNGRPALPFLHTPGGSSLSASHTVNGHSVVLRLAYGNVRFLFGADLNEESEERLLERARKDGLSLAAEVLKVPHHGSADFSPRILEAIRPVVSVVSSGDENSTKEYIHPRAGLVGALGKFSRAGVDRPLVYVTEMVAFFKRLGTVQATRLGPDGRQEDLGRVTNAYAKTAFGIVHVRTDGERVLVTTHSGKDDLKESYAFRVDPRGEIAFDKPRIL